MVLVGRNYEHIISETSYLLLDNYSFNSEIFIDPFDDGKESKRIR